MDLTAAIVLFNHKESQIRHLIESVLNTSLDIRLYLIDNSPTDELRGHFAYDKVVYIFNNANLGYGRAHNIGVEKSLELNAKYHVILNPDLEMGAEVIDNIYQYMERNEDLGLVMPKILNEDGSMQHLCKLLPTPFDLLGRRFFGSFKWARRLNDRYELRTFSGDYVLDTPCLSGCFMFIRTGVLRQVGGFDPRYFMYLEDYDLVRRIHRVARTVFYPEVFVVHQHGKWSYKKSSGLLKHHIQSAIKYFNKWGWFYDSERRRYNANVLSQIEVS